MYNGHPLFCICFLFSFFLFVLCLFACVCVCCVCASRSPGPRKEQHERDDELYIESAPSHKNLYSYLLNVRTFPPKRYTILKRIFAFTMRLPPNICTICVPTFPRDFPQKDFTILVPTLSMCDSPRDIVRSTQIDMLSVIHRVICVQKALSDAARAFCS